VWQGSAGDRRPYADQTAFRRSGTVSHSSGIRRIDAPRPFAFRRPTSIKRSDRAHEDRHEYCQNPSRIAVLCAWTEAVPEVPPVPQLEGCAVSSWELCLFRTTSGVLAPRKWSSGVLFLIGRYVALAIALGGPVIVNIIARIT
jgi:hypothetical protein